MAPSVSIKYYGDPRALTAMRSELLRDMSRRGRNVETAAKRLCPVDTGRLRSSINSAILQRPTTIQAIISSNVSYAPFVENGTSRMKGRHFLLRALPAALK